MLVLPPRTVLFLIASERRHARSASNTIQAKHSVVIRRDVEDRRSVVEHADIRKAEDVLRHDLSFRGLPSRASLAYTGLNRHASDTRIGLMDSTVPVEAVVNRD